MKIKKNEMNEIKWNAAVNLVSLFIQLPSFISLLCLTLILPSPRLCICCCSSLLTADTIMLVSGLYFHRCDDFERQFVISFTPSPIFPHYCFLQTLIHFILNTMQFQSSEIDYIGA